MANLIEISSVSVGINNTGNIIASGSAQKVLLNVANILSVTTLATAVGPSSVGVTQIVYNYPVNNSESQATIVVTEARSAVLAAANAALA